VELDTGEELGLVAAEEPTTLPKSVDDEPVVVAVEPGDSGRAVQGRAGWS
jgi:hypothetical protein